jgi:hypothetical protein
LNIPRLPFLAVGLPLFGRKLIARNIDVVVLERANDRSRRREQTSELARQVALGCVVWRLVVAPRLRLYIDADSSSRLSHRAWPVALPLLPSLQGKHRDRTARLAAPKYRSITMNMLHDTDAWNFCRWRRSSATRLVRLRRGVQRLAGRKPERLATPHALAAIALQVQQSLWRSCISGPLDHEGAPRPSRRRQTCSGRTSSTGLQSLHAEKAS